MTWNHKQRQLIAEFLSNFALAWISLGLIAPVFSPIENIKLFIIKLITGLFMGTGSLTFALRLIK